MLCREPPKPICAGCAGSVLRPHPVARAVSGFALADFNPATTQILSAIKDHGQTALVRPLLHQARDVLGAALEATQELTLVPIPSSDAATRRRGFSPAQVWAKQLAYLLRTANPSRTIRVCAALEFRKSVADQRGLGVEQRQQNLHGSMRVTRSGEQLEGRVLLVDDVVTTGATVAEAARALGASRVDDLQFLAFAETLLKTDVSKSKWV